jgi:hypothetical protein
MHMPEKWKLGTYSGKNTRDYPAGGLSGIVGLVQQDPERAALYTYGM